MRVTFCISGIGRKHFFCFSIIQQDIVSQVAATSIFPFGVTAFLVHIQPFSGPCMQEEDECWLYTSSISYLFCIELVK
ncbi:hypothetical protein CW304_12090 [Bacillus sp. UFRGS-B20]|nr:hypothetical protein CW304_12090 [Bacillus sp. UFRGS-B20]